MELKNERRYTARCASIREVEPREDGTKPDGRTVEGYAIVFNEESVLLDDWGERFVEIIDPRACTQEYVDACDIKMTLFHNRECLLARYMPNRENNSMKLTVDEVGVKFVFDAPNTAEGDKCLEGVKRGDLSGCSFTFKPKDYVTETREDGTLLIRHTAFDWLGEMTIGSDPAYNATSVNCREVTKCNESDDKQNADAEREAKERAEREATEKAMTERAERAKARSREMFRARR